MSQMSTTMCVVAVVVVGAADRGVNNNSMAPERTDARIYISSDEQHSSCQITCTRSPLSPLASSWSIGSRRRDIVAVNLIDSVRVSICA